MCVAEGKSSTSCGRPAVRSAADIRKVLATDYVVVGDAVDHEQRSRK